MRIALALITTIIIAASALNMVVEKLDRLEKQVKTLQLQYDYIALELTSGKANIYKSVPRHIEPNGRLLEK